jgi:hypothetical protein
VELSVDWPGDWPSATATRAAVSNPSARVIALIHHTMLVLCVVRATLKRRNRKVVALVGRRAHITDMAWLRVVIVPTSLVATLVENEGSRR